jgi:N-acetylglutamate synthase-like GNAT family acetyltransferase
VTVDTFSLRIRPFHPSDSPDDCRGRFMMALTVHVGDHVVGFGGLEWVDDKVFAFLDVLDEAYRKPFVIHRMGLAVIKAAKAAELTHVFTFCDETQPNAEKWLARLGFKPLPDRERTDKIKAFEAEYQKEIYVLWPQQQQ